MVWEQNSSLVLMLTKFKEIQRIKADPYWIDDVGKSSKHFDLELVLREKVEDDDLILRIFFLI
jgi:hypothetical protein